MRTAQMEDDVHRVLQLVRSQRVLSKARSKTSTNKETNDLKKEHEIRQVQVTPTSARLRHTHTTQANTHRPATRLVQAKTQALMAIYGLRTADPAATQLINDCGRSDAVVSETTRQELLDVRRRIYRNHFSGLQATYGPSGRPKLDTLIDAAMDAKRTFTSVHSSTGTVGAAVLTSANRIYTAGRIESVHHASLDVCAERAVLLKVTEYQQQQQQQHRRLGEMEVVEAMVICSDQRGLLLPMPCGACRELLAEFGDFPVFLLNADHESQETRSFELFPHARRHQLAATATTTATAPVAQPRTATTGTKSPASKSPASQFPMDVRDWSCEQVAQWLVDVVELLQYKRLFQDKRVDGATLWLLQDSDLQLLLGVTHPLHRRRVLLHIDRLKDRDLLDHGIDFGQLHDYLAVLDGDRLDVVAQLKTIFDRLDQNKDGFLDFGELKSALQSLDLDLDLDGTGHHRSSALLTEQLLQSLAGSGSSSESGEVSFPVFVKAFSQLAQLPAGELRDAPKALFPTVDLVALRTTFDRADANKSGSIDETELVSILESMGRFDDCQQRARAWFQHADENGDARLSFAEFFLRYAQLTKLDLTAIQSLFTSEKHGDYVTNQGVERALHKLYPHVAMADIHAWCQRRPWADSGDPSTGSKSLTFATFALACVAYGHALQSRVERLQRMQRALHNDALCHRSRIVHLQQSGHVRLCRHPGGSGGEEEEPHGKEEVSLRERRRRIQAAKSSRISRTHTREETKEEEEEEEEDAVATVFRRFALAGNTITAPRETSHRQRRRSRGKEEDDDDGKQQSAEEEEEEEDTELRLNAVEAAQALLELGVVCSREQLLRYLDREGFGLRRCLPQHEFARIWKRLQLLQAMPRGLNESQKEIKQRELWAAIGRAEADRHQPETPPQRALTPRHANRRDYDAYLRSQHTLRQQKRSGQKGEEEGKDGDDEVEDKPPRRSRQRSKELRRSQSRNRRTRNSSYASSSSSSSSSISHSRRGRSRSRSHRRLRHRRDSSRSTSTASSSRSSSTSSSSSRRASTTHKSRKTPPRRRPPSFRGLEVGDRVTSHAHGGGSGTLVRVYRDFFVADVHFDSGVRAKNVDLSLLRRVAFENQKKQPTNQNQKEAEQRKRRALLVGVSVRVAHKGTTAASRKATILTCRSDGTFDVVANEHGEQELLRRVPLSQLQLLRKPIVYSEAQRVTVRRPHEYLRGRVAVCRTNGTYDVCMAKGTVLRELAWELLAPDEEAAEDGEEEEQEEEEEGKKTSLHQKRRRGAKEEEGEEDGKEADSDDGFEPEFQKGDRVEARFQGQLAYYSGRITRVFSDGACDVAYDDGDAESRVPPQLIRAAVATAVNTKKRDVYEDDFESD